MSPVVLGLLVLDVPYVAALNLSIFGFQMNIIHDSQG